MTGPARYGVVVIGASAGGTEALRVLLGGLTAPLPAPVLVAVHLGPAVSRLDALLSRISPMPVEWLTDGTSPRAGRVYLCPGRSFVSLEPDGTCTVTGSPGTSLGVVDQLFTSAAASVGSRLLAVVLSGAGRDGAAGARIVKQAGGAVVIQDEATAAAFGMGGAVLDAGDADLVLPLGELADVVEQVVGRGRPLPTPARRAADAMFSAGGDMGRLMSTTDWDATPLGPVDGWSPTLRSVLSMMLSHALPMNLLWGPERLRLYNDASIDLLAGFHPAALGRPIAGGRPEADLEPLLREVDRTGRALLTHDQPFVLRGSGRPEETFLTFCYSPVLDDGRAVAVLGTAVDTTSRVLADRRLTALHRLARMTVDAGSTEADVCAEAVRILAHSPGDVPFALLYLVDPGGIAALSATTGLAESSPALIPALALAQSARWPAHATLGRSEPRVVDDLQVRVPGLAAGPWREPPDTAVILPVGAARDGGGPPAVLIAGVSSNNGFDADYRRFFDLVAEQIGAVLAGARARRDERERIAARAELDRSRSDFVANVSHELRTPLTLMLLPLQELIDELGHGAGAEPARLAQRNALRLARLVDKLLSLAEAGPGRARPVVREVDDLAARTAEIAEVFRPAVEGAGLRLDVDCPSLDRPVRLDLQMWEAVVLNLVSNAFKHTFTGGISVRLTARVQHVELIVSDTGIGIPAAEIAHVFTRFHRIPGARARSYEGSGIGLALVQQLVRLHRGSVRLRSRPGEGSTFTVWVPYQQTADPGVALETGDGTAGRDREVFADEAGQWSTAGPLVPEPVPGSAGPRAVVLVVADNDDMRRFLSRSLADRYEVEIASGVAEGIRLLAARTWPVDLVISDVMTPERDGLALVRHVRADPALTATPVMVLTASSGTEAVLRLLAAGANDYLIKPFTVRELISRTESQLQLARLRPGPV
jgi:signal transduction histidine kinase/chemotaxis response regulator CheB